MPTAASRFDAETATPAPTRNGVEPVAELRRPQKAAVLVELADVGFGHRIGAGLQNERSFLRIEIDSVTELAGQVDVVVHVDVDVREQVLPISADGHGPQKIAVLGKFDEVCVFVARTVQREGEVRVVVKVDGESEIAAEQNIIGSVNRHRRSLVVAIAAKVTHDCRREGSAVGRQFEQERITSRAERIAVRRQRSDAGCCADEVAGEPDIAVGSAGHIDAAIIAGSADSGGPNNAGADCVVHQERVRSAG